MAEVTVRDRCLCALRPRQLSLPPHNLVAELPEALRLLPSPIDAAKPWLNNVLSPSASLSKSLDGSSAVVQHLGKTDQPRVAKGRWKPRTGIGPGIFGRAAELRRIPLRHFESACGGSTPPGATRLSGPCLGGRPLGLAAALSVVRSLLRLLLGVQFTPPVYEPFVQGSGTSLSSRVAERPVQG
jgi:hypothetical protein